MARGPGRPRLNQDVVEPDVIEGEFSEAMSGDAKKTADEMADAMDTISSLTGNDVQVLIYKASRNGPWEHVMEMTPPIDMTEIVRQLKAEYGGGKYSFRVRASGKIRTTKFVHLAVPAAGPVVTGGLGGSSDFITLMMNQSNQARQDQLQNMQMMMTMMNNSQSTMMGVLTAIIGKPTESDSSKLLATVEALKAISPPQEKSNFKEMLENMTMLKTLAGDGGGAGEDMSLMGMAKSFLPALGSMAADAMKNGGNNNGQPMQVLPTPAPRSMGDGAGYGAIPRQIGAPETGQPTPSYQPQVQTNPVVAAIRDDVLYLMRKPHDPELAAEVIIASLDAAQIGEAEFNALAMDVLSAGEQWPQKVAQYGIDVAGREEWFSRVVTILAEHYGATADNGGGDDPERGEGGASDPANNVSLGQLRRAQPAG